MRILGSIIGVALIMIGVMWFFQGIGVFPGSFMTGQTKWAVYGAITALAGIAVFWRSRRAV